MKHRGKTNPPGRIKIMASFSALMGQKDFNSITTAEIARNASVTEGLIYKYFRDKKDLLYQVLNEHFTAFQREIKRRVTLEQSSIAKLEVLVHTSLASYADNRLLSRMLMLEVRHSPDYFESSAYAMVKEYAATILDIIRDGIASGEIRPATDPYLLRKVILGAIEHACLGEIVFGREFDIDKLSTGISDILFNGVRL